VTGLIQKLRLPDLPVYQPDGPIPLRTRNVQVFRELDRRPGYCAALRYACEGLLDIEAMQGRTLMGPNAVHRRDAKTA
jgi:hypothetical protein